MRAKFQQLDTFICKIPVLSIIGGVFPSLRSGVSELPSETDLYSSPRRGGRQPACLPLSGLLTLRGSLLITSPPPAAQRVIRVAASRVARPHLFSDFAVSVLPLDSASRSPSYAPPHTSVASSPPFCYTADWEYDRSRISPIWR